MTTGLWDMTMSPTRTWKKGESLPYSEPKRCLARQRIDVTTIQGASFGFVGADGKSLHENLYCAETYEDGPGDENCPIPLGTFEHWDVMIEYLMEEGYIEIESIPAPNAKPNVKPSGKPQYTPATTGAGDFS